MSWTPDWTLPPAPKGDDEEAVIAFRAVELRAVPQETVVPWDALDEWQRESWRREYRDS